jgi:chromosomal replication initiation ATPase DnaA
MTPVRTMSREERERMQILTAQIEGDNAILAKLKEVRTQQAVLLRDMQKGSLERTQGIQRILTETAIDHGTNVAEIAGKGRHATICQVRWDFFSRARSAGYSLNEIGRSVNKDHGTVLHGLRKLSNPSPQAYTLCQKV